MMKLRWILLLVCILLVLPVVAVTGHRIKFNGEFYTLQVAEATPAVEDGYRNVYLRSHEKLNSWTRMIVIQTYPNLDNPNEAAMYLKNTYPVSSAPDIGDFVVSKRGTILPLVLLNPNGGKPSYENNVIRFEKSKNGGLISYQYIERYPVKNFKQAQKALNTMRAGRARLIQLVKKVTIPNVVREIK